MPASPLTAVRTSLTQEPAFLGEACALPLHLRLTADAPIDVAPVIDRSEYPSFTPAPGVAVNSSINYDSARDGDLPANDWLPGEFDFTIEHSYGDAQERLWSQAQCGKGSLVGVNPETHKAIVVPMRCKSWECPVCAPRKRAEWTRKLASGKPDKVLTLTADPKIAADLVDRARLMKAAWRKLVGRIRFHAKLHPRVRWLPRRSRLLKLRAMRHRGESAIWTKREEVEYALVWELAGTDHLHVHILLRAPYIPQGWLSWNWNQLGVGYVTHVKQTKGPVWEAAHATKSLGAPAHNSHIDPVDYVTKSTAVTAGSIAPLKIIQISSGYVIAIHTAVVDPDRKNFTWARCMLDAGQVMRNILARKMAHTFHTRADGSYELELRSTVTASDVIDEGDPIRK